MFSPFSFFFALNTFFLSRQFFVRWGRFVLVQENNNFSFFTFLCFFFYLLLLLSLFVVVIVLLEIWCCKWNVNALFSAAMSPLSLALVLFQQHF